MSASSHPRRARPGESGCDCPGSAGSFHIEAGAAVSCLTWAWMMQPNCSHQAHPSPKPTPYGQGPESLLGRGPSERWIFGSLLLPDWNRRQEGEISLSPYMMSAAIHFLHIFTCILFLVTWVILYMCGLAMTVCFPSFTFELNEERQRRLWVYRKTCASLQMCSFIIEPASASTDKISMLVLDTFAVRR